jgi:CRP-like cAMP-binding protein
MANDGAAASVPTRRLSPGLQRVLRQLPMGAPELWAIEAGEIDAVIDYGSANAILFPDARRALRDRGKRTAAAEHRARCALPRRNGVLAAVHGAAYRRLMPALEPVLLEAGDVLHEAGAPIRHVYFPVDCVICLLTTIDDPQTVATGLVGHEGMAGIPLALEVGVSAVRAEVQVSGTALRMAATPFTNELKRGPQLRRQLYRYVQMELTQARLMAACIASHHFEQRLASWFLMIADRASVPEMCLTQEQLAAALNVRRVSVTLASGSLRSCGLISYHRGRIAILDRAGLERASCGCWRPVEATTRHDD